MGTGFPITSSECDRVDLEHMYAPRRDGWISDNRFGRWAVAVLLRGHFDDFIRPKLFRAGASALCWWIALFAFETRIR